MDKFDLLKSHIEAFTRKDGSVVAAHDDKRVARKINPPSGWRAAHDHAEAKSDEAWNNDGSHEDAISALRTSVKLHKKAASDAANDGDVGAENHHNAKAAAHSTMMIEHQRRSAQSK